MKLWKKDKPEETSGFGAASGGAVGGASVTPTEVQEKKFRRSSRPSGGYVMREVDEFLDEITDTLTALIAENERLRLAAGTSPAERAASVPARDGEDRAAVDTFLQREKAFLQDLGGLVQAHAVELKSMVRSARVPGAPAEAAAVPAPAAASAPAVETTAPPQGAAAASVETAAAAEEDEPIAPTAQEEPAEPPTAQEEPAEAPTETTTGVVAEEPIRLEEPEPARSGRADEQDRSLRELFWGED